jgi:hypothetical protein
MPICQYNCDPNGQTSSVNRFIAICRYNYKIDKRVKLIVLLQYANISITKFTNK